MIPGITFIDLFAWLAEIEHYRLNRTSADSFARFFTLAGVRPFGPSPAEVAVTFEFEVLPQGLLLPAYTRIWAIGHESMPFQTVRDQYLTAARLKHVTTKTKEREIVKDIAELNEAGHYEAFGSAPAVGDSLELKFEHWFREPEGQLTITLFEDDLPRREPLPPDARGFEPSATVSWEYRIASGNEPQPHWQKLDVIEDGTLNLSRSGKLIFRSPEGAAAEVQKTLRAVVSDGRYEIPPRIVSIRTNTVCARQVQIIVNEDLNAGKGTADQIVRLRKVPVLVSSEVNEGPFQTGEVLDWKILIDRLKRAEELYKSPLKETVVYVAGRIIAIHGTLPDLPDNKDDPSRLEEEYRLAQSLNELLSDTSFYQPASFAGVTLAEEFLEAGRERTCKRQSFVRRLNRFLLQRVFPDLIISDRVEIQVGSPAERAEDEIKTWTTWEPVDDFLKSGPDDHHYVLDPNAGTIRFGNGLNGRVPESTERIRARFYRHSELEQGNLAANLQWALGIQLPRGTQIKRQTNLTPAAGGKTSETLAETRSRSREVFRKERALLTADDYEDLVLNTPGLRVARIKVKPNFNPNMPSLKLPGQITIIVLPQPPPRKAFPSAAPPEASEGFLKTIRRHIDTRRQVTTDVFVIGPRYKPVAVSCRVFLKKRSSETSARENIDRALREFFHPVFGGPDKGLGWPFGRSVFPSEVSQLLAKLPEVDYVLGVKLNDLKVGASLTLRYDELPTAAPRHDIVLIPFESRGIANDTSEDSGSCKGGDDCG